MELNMVTFTGMVVIALLIGVGVYALATRVSIRNYEYETDENGNDKVIDKNE